LLLDGDRYQRTLMTRPADQRYVQFPGPLDAFALVEELPVSDGFDLAAAGGALPESASISRSVCIASGNGCSSWCVIGA
jgi:hypothetical protein